MRNCVRTAPGSSRQNPSSLQMLLSLSREKKKPTKLICFNCGICGHQSNTCNKEKVKNALNAAGLATSPQPAQNELPRTRTTGFTSWHPSRCQRQYSRVYHRCFRYTFKLYTDFNWQPDKCRKNTLIPPFWNPVCNV